MKVSVILPVYGVAEYVVKCTESLLNQTIDDIEFLFVDDHGKDNSIDLIKQTIKGHRREQQFRILRPEKNLGAGMARNYALQYATGEYIAFVDSDDWIEPQMFQLLYDEAKAKGSVDLCYCQIIKDYSDNKPSEVVSNPIVESGKFEGANKAYFLTHYISMFSTYLFRRELIEQYHIRFPEERSADDSYFVSAALFVANTIAHVDQPLYHYLIRPGSVTTTKISTKYQKRLKVFSKLLQFAKQSGTYSQFQNEVDFLYLKKGGLSSLFSYISNSETPAIGTLKEIMNEIDTEVPAYKTNPYYRHSLSLRLLVFTINHCPRLAIKLISKHVARTKQVL